MATEPLAFPPAPDGDPWGDTPLSELPVVAFDTETGGLDPFKDPLLTVGLASLEGPIGEWTVYHEDYRPTDKILEINRITGRRVAEATPWLLIEPLLEHALEGRVVLGHNVGFDLCYLVTNSPQLALSPAIDTAAICRFLWPGKPAKLEHLCERARVENTNAHGAGADAWAAMRGWVFLRNALRHQGIDTWNKLCAARAAIPSNFDRPPWPDQVAAAHAKAKLQGRVPRRGSSAAS